MHKGKEEPWLGSGLSSASRMIREPGCSQVLPLGEHKGCPLVALSSLLASFSSGGCPCREQPGHCRSSLSPGQLQGQTGHSCSTSQPCLDAEWPVLTVTVETPCHLQDLPKAGQILLRISFPSHHGAGKLVLGYQHNSPVSPGDLRPLGNTKVHQVGFGKGRGTAPAALWKDDSCLGWEEAGKPACAGRPAMSHIPLLSSFVDLLHQNCKSFPKCALSPSCCAGLLVSHCSSAAFLNSSSSTYLHALCQNQHESEGKNRVQTKVPKS